MIRQDRKKYKIVLIILGLFIFLNSLSLLKPLNRGLGMVMNFFSFGLRKNYIASKESKEDLIKRVNDLEFRLAEEKASSSLLAALQEENRELREFFNFLENKKYNYILADIVWSDGLLPHASTNQDLFINRGSRHGLYPGLGVLSESGVLIGKIVEVKDDYAQICLGSNSFCRLAVSINNKERSSGLAEGNLGLLSRISFIPQDEKIDIGDLVYSSGLEQDIPKGLYFGEVVNVEKKENDIWQEIMVEPLFDPRRLKRVAVIVPEQY